MIARPIHRLLIACATLAMTAPLVAQQSSSTPPATATATTATATTAAAAPAAAQPAAKTAAADVPNPDILKKARNAGFHTRVRHNVVYYCKTDTEIGTRFPTEQCFNEDQLMQHLEFVQAQKDQLVGHTCGGSGCSGK